ncbi:MAG TPA: DUF499 domain-containing protein [Syntrophales bacterium]|nr:DUF499 domain-containing protein [Syntrophales bacterium]
MAKLSWKPWHEVVKLRDDLKAGKLPLHLFAADLYEVVMQSGKRPVYEKPEEFFSLTFPTYNLRQLARDVVLRLAGQNDKAVRQLELTYGGGKTHTLITLRHLVHDPGKLPKLPAVDEFIETIGQRPPRCRVAALCFDKLDVEKGMGVRSPDGKSRMLRQPWSVLAWQVAGEEGLRLLHAEGKPEERESAPAENLLTELLEKPLAEGLGILILIDEVLLYAREKIGRDSTKLQSLVNFFQYLTQAATKVDRCCIVASLLTSEPTTEDELGRKIKAQLYNIFQRQREAAVEPVVKEDVAEVLRRRFFKPESLKDRDSFRQHVVAAIKGIAAVDDQTAKDGAEAEDRFFRNYPFHPDLTDVFYSKWTQLDRFQRTRGVLRTFALALREAGEWDRSPLIGPNVFLAAPGKEGLSEALQELVTVADTEEWEGKKQAWAPILDSEFQKARQIQDDSAGLRYREIEQAVVAAFLHSQPIGSTARTRDLTVLAGSTRPDRIELEKGLIRWAQTSHWLDDLYASAAGGASLPDMWRLGNKPNLTQMHADAARNISDPAVQARLLDEIGRLKVLTASASAAGVKVHMLPTRPRDIEDDGTFHYAVLGPAAASDSGKPCAEAKRFLDETTGPDKPRVYRNAVLLLAPSKDGVELAMSRVKDLMAWDAVQEHVRKQQQDGNVDPARAQTLQIQIDRAKGRIPDAIKQAYCIVVTVSEKNDNHAFKITITDDPNFITVKNDSRSRLRETPIAAEALLPDGPYDLWREKETSRRVKDLAGAFAQLPHLPKMLKASAILNTLADGCEKGAFVLRLTRPDGSSRTWWMARPDEAALNDPAMELVLPQAAELQEIPSSLLAPKQLPWLWTGDEITVQDVSDFFSGKTVVQIEKDGYKEPLAIPKASAEVIEQAVTAAVENSNIWLRSGPASILGETIPPGIFSAKASLCIPPPPVTAPALLPENLPGAWKKGYASGLSIATALSVKESKALPWKTTKDAISGALQARFLELDDKSRPWPCDLPDAKAIILKTPETPPPPPPPPGKLLSAEADLDPNQIQDLAEIVPELLKIKAEADIPIQFRVRIEVGDGKSKPPEDVAAAFSKLMESIKEKWVLK